MKWQEEIMIERKAKVAVNEWITHGNDAFLLTGARQSGKTYLIRQCLKKSGYPYIELNFIEQPELVNLFAGAKNAKELLMRLSVVAKEPLEQGKTIIFLDEITSSGFNIYSPTLVRGMKPSEITAMAKAFGQAVHLAREAGMDAVEIHAGHGYLISQFLSPYTNHRKDEYGGSLQNRMRFMKMCMDEVMKAAGQDMAVLVKINMRDGFKGGMELDETLEVARTLQNECGAHALILSGGFVSRAPMYVMRGSMPIHTMTHYMPFGWLPLGVKMAGRFMIPSEPFKEAYFLEDALKFRAALKMPLVYVGGLISREKIDEVLNDGFEFVSMARALLNDPSFVNKMKEDEHARCDCGHSNYCIARMYSIEMACHKHIQNLPKSIVKEIEKLEYK